MTPTQKQRIAEIEKRLSIPQYLLNDRDSITNLRHDLRFLLELVRAFPSRLESTNCVAYAESTTEVITERKEQP